MSKQHDFFDLSIQHSTVDNSVALLRHLSNWGFTDVAFTSTFCLSETKEGRKKRQISTNTGAKEPWSFPSIPPVHDIFEKAKLATPNGLSIRRVLRRLNVVVDDNQNLSLLRCENVRNYDLIAMQPANLEALKFICQTNAFKPDIITLDLLTASCLPLPHKILKAAVRKGVIFELSIASTINDSESRRKFMIILNAYNTIFNWKAIILSSNAVTSGQIRSPSDLISLHTLFNVPENRFLACFRETPKSLLDMAFTNRHSAGGMFLIDQENIALLYNDDESMPSNGSDNDADDNLPDKTSIEGKTLLGST